LAAFLSDALSVLGDRRAAVAVELTKKFEKVHQGWLGDLSRMFDGETVKGEVTVVIAGKNTKFIHTEEELTKESVNAEDSLFLEANRLWKKEK